MQQGGGPYDNRRRATKKLLAFQEQMTPAEGVGFLVLVGGSLFFWSLCQQISAPVCVFFFGLFMLVPQCVQRGCEEHAALTLMQVILAGVPNTFRIFYASSIIRF
jgi:hypothetical protein